MFFPSRTTRFRLLVSSIILTYSCFTLSMEPGLHPHLTIDLLADRSLQKPTDYDSYPAHLKQWSTTPITPYRNMTILRTEKKGERFDVCFTFAITEHLGITGQAPEKLKISAATDLLTECNILNRYYQPTENASPNCLVVYTDQKGTIKHFGILTKPSASNDITQHMVKSKWGTKNAIIEHELFNVPAAYGNHAFLYEFKDEFKHNTASVLELLQQSIKESKKIQQTLIANQILLLQLANGKNTVSPNNSDFNKQYSIEDKAWFLLKTCMGLSINTRNNSMHQTVLTLATKRNDTKLMEMFLYMGANINQKDKDGNTALMIAAQNNYQEAMYTLLCYGADTTLQNNQKYIALVPSSIKTQANEWSKILISICKGTKLITGNEMFDSGTINEQLRFILTECEGTNINAQEIDTKRTALMIAAYKNNLPVVQLLIEHGADITLRDTCGLTALDYATIQNNTEIAEYIKKQMS
jgi:ankyrin repeat protein